MNTLLKILIIVTSYGELAGEPNGTYMPEVTHFVHVLQEAGIDYDFASPMGGEMPVYGLEIDDLTKEMMEDEGFKEKISKTLSLAEIDPTEYDAVFFPGGYGLLFDLVEDTDSHRIVKDMIERGAPVAAVCHGPAALAKIKKTDGAFLISGLNITGFSREEEIDFGTIDKIPFVLEEHILDAGATYQKRNVWQEFVVEDGLIITGQNPASASAVGHRIVEKLSAPN